MMAEKDLKTGVFIDFHSRVVHCFKAKNPRNADCKRVTRFSTLWTTHIAKHVYIISHACTMPIYVIKIYTRNSCSEIGW